MPNLNIWDVSGMSAPCRGEVAHVDHETGMS